MENLTSDNNSREFYIWIDLDDPMTHNNVYNVKWLGSTPSTNSDNRDYLPNPKFNNFINPFQSNLIHGYMVEYNLEEKRRMYMNM